MADHPPPSSPFEPPSPPIVGRAHEQDILREGLAATLAGRGGLVLIGGEAGIGKTTLVSLLTSEAAQHDALVLVGGCYDLMTTPPYGPWIDLTAQHPMGPTDPDLPTVLRRDDTAGAVASMGALFEEARAAIATLSETRPLVIVLEDLHWADAASIDLLRFVGRHARRLPLLLVATYRSEEVLPDHPLYPALPLLVRESGAEHINLRRLAAGEVVELIGRRYRLADADTRRLSPYLLGHTEGNPLYLNELLRTLEEERLLRVSLDGWALGDLTTVVVPRLIRHMIVGRAARLDETLRYLLLMASVIGQDAPLDVWSALSGVSDDALLAAAEQAEAANFLTITSNGLAVRFVHALIRDALYESVPPSRRLIWHRRIAEILEQTAGASPDAVAYHYQAASDPRAATWLIRAGESAERAYAWTTAAARFEAALPLLAADPAAQRLSGSVQYHLGLLLRFATSARGLAHLDGARRIAHDTDDRVLSALSLAHSGLVRCVHGDTQRGVSNLEAGVAAQDELTPDEWLEAYRLQRTLTDSLQSDLSNEGAAAAAIATIASQQRGALVLQLAHVTLRYRDAVALGEAHAQQIKALDDDDALLRHTSTMEGGSWIDTYYGLGEAYAVLGEVEASERAFARAKSLYRAAGHHAVDALVVTQHAWRIQLPYRADDREQWAQWLAAAIASEQQAEGAHRAGWLPGMPRLPRLLLDAAWDEAHDIATNMVEHQPAVVAISAEVALGNLARARGDLDTAWALVRGRLPRGPDSDPTETVAMSAFDLAQLAAALALDVGDVATAERWLEAFDRWLTESGRVLGRAEARLLWATVHLSVGNLGRAREEAQRALDHASSPRQPVALLAVHRLLGVIATRDRRLVEAEQHFETALELAAACGAPFERALTLLELAELRAAAGRTDDAERLADEVRMICVPLQAAPTLARVDALVAQLAAGSRSPVFPAGLTPREVDVLRLVAQGLTDAEVAERLYLARRTVNSHLTSIYTKLDVSNRAGATRFAVEHGLT
ncbi:MAG TPA: AAA family ATPase [Thermomicrobiales bacterium]|nr:AAA family ATPase [Thermomicrobiales bacterium]